MCEGMAISGSLTGDKRMTCRSPRLTDGSLACGVTVSNFTSVLHLVGFISTLHLAPRLKSIKRMYGGDNAAGKHDSFYWWEALGTWYTICLLTFIGRAIRTSVVSISVRVAGERT
jgi:hypothetical protein